MVVSTFPIGGRICREGGRGEGGREGGEEGGRREGGEERGRREGGNRLPVMNYS